MSDQNSTKLEPFERTEQTKSELKSLMADRRAVRMVRDFMERSADYRDPHLDLARKSRELYENWRGSGTSIIQRANLRLPFGFTIVETQLPQLTDIFIKDEKFIVFKGRDAEDAMWEDVLTDFHVHQFDEMNFASKFISFCKGMLIDGTGFAKLPYVYKEALAVKRTSMMDPVSGEMIIDKSRTLEVLYDGPDFDVIPIWDFYPDWSVKNPGDVAAMRGCVHRMFKTLASLRSARMYKNLDEVERSLGSKGSDAWSKPYYTDEYKEDFEDLQDNQKGAKDGSKIEIWEYWGMYDPQGNGEFEQYLITVANGDVVIRIQENPFDYKFKPFLACPNVIRDNEFYGIPELVSVRSLIKEANAIRNARLDNINLAVNPMWVVDRAAGINDKNLYSRPHGIIWANDVNGIKKLEPGDPSLGSRDEFSQIQADIQNATALVASAPVLGQLGKAFGRSATGVEFISNIASNRLGLKARLLANLLFKPMAWMMLMLNRQFVTQEHWVRVSNPDTPNPFVQLSPDAFFRRYDFQVKTDLETGGPEAEFQRVQAASQILQVAEQSQPGTVKFDIVLDAMLRPIIGNTVKRFVRDESERQMMMQQQLAGQQMVNAGIGQQAPQPNAQQPMAPFDLTQMMK